MNVTIKAGSPGELRTFTINRQITGEYLLHIDGELYSASGEYSIALNSLKNLVAGWTQECVDAQLMQQDVEIK